MAGQFGKQGAGTKGYLGHRDDTTDPDKDKRECENCKLVDRYLFLVFQNETI